MKKLIIFLFVLISSFTFSQTLDLSKSFESLDINEKELIKKMFGKKSTVNSEDNLKFIDSTLNITNKTSKVYPLVLSLAVTAYEENRIYKKAIDGYNELLSLGVTEQFMIFNRLSLLYKYNDQIDKSIEILKKQIEKYPQESIGYSNLTNTYLLLHKYDEALKILESNKNESRLDDDFKHYAEIYLNNNEFEKAKKQIDKFLETEFGKQHYSGFLIAAKVYNKINDKNTACKNIIEAEKLILSINIDSQKMSPDSFLIKNLNKDKKEIIDLKKEICK